MSVRTGEDGVLRCGWAGSDPEYLRYHDEEWGTPLHGDRPIFEKIVLEGFQAGLSWLTVLRRRDGFRRAFHGFDIETVARFEDEDVDRLMADPGIIRNRAKILAAIGNARAVRRLTDPDPGALDRLLWGYAPPPRAAPPADAAAIPSHTPESRALSRELKSRGLRFVGPTTMYALMQSGGLVDDHVAGCWRAASPATPVGAAGLNRP